MLHAWKHPKTGEIRLYVQGVAADAWISSDPPLDEWRGHDWALFVRSGATATAEKCPTKIEVESRLRAWLLKRCGRPLYTLRFSDLAKLAEGTIR